MGGVQRALERMRVAAKAVSALEFPYPISEPHFGPACCEAEIDELLGTRRRDVPEYAELLSLCRRVEAADIHNGYFLFSPLVVVRQVDMPRRLHVGTEPHLSEVDVLAIGGDGGGNGFVLGTSSPCAGTVWKWDHERPIRVDGVATGGMTLVAKTLGAFLERIALDWEHFIADDRSWNYMSG